MIGRLCLNPFKQLCLVLDDTIRQLIGRPWIAPCPNLFRMDWMFIIQISHSMLALVGRRQPIFQVKAAARSELAVRHAQGWPSFTRQSP